MAVDEALLDEAADDGAGDAAVLPVERADAVAGLLPALRRAATQHAASRGAAVVRRLSGGGALVHDRELTYSLCLPASHPAGRDVARPLRRSCIER